MLFKSANQRAFLATLGPAVVSMISRTPFLMT